MLVTLCNESKFMYHWSIFKNFILNVNVFIPYGEAVDDSRKLRYVPRHDVTTTVLCFKIYEILQDMSEKDKLRLYHITLHYAMCLPLLWEKIAVASFCFSYKYDSTPKWASQCWTGAETHSLFFQLYNFLPGIASSLLIHSVLSTCLPSSSQFCFDRKFHIAHSCTEESATNDDLRISLTMSKAVLITETKWDPVQIRRM